jgi:glycosyltransferase involved in cell wall biosynthesis
MKQQSRILIIHQKNSIGGSQTYIEELFKGLKRKHTKVEFLEGVSGFRMVTEIFKKNTKEVVWSINSGGFPIWAFIISFLFGRKNAFLVYGFWNLEVNFNLEEKKRGGLRLLLGKIRVKLLFAEEFLFCFLSSSIIHLSQYGEDIFYSFPLFEIFRAKKQIIIYGGADQKVFFPIKTKNNLRSRLGINHDDIILLMVGRIQERKNYLAGIYLLEELRRTLKYKHVFLYWVVSYGPYNDMRYFEKVIQKAKDLGVSRYLRIISGVTGTDLSHFYQTADIFLMLSAQLETFGLVTLEALSCGCPVFGYNTSATSELLGANYKDYLAPLGKNKELAHLIYMYLVKSKKEKISLKNSRLKKTSKFTWDKSVDLLIQTLNYS